MARAETAVGAVGGAAEVAAKAVARVPAPTQLAKVDRVAKAAKVAARNRPVVAVRTPPRAVAGTARGVAEVAPAMARTPPRVVAVEVTAPGVAGTAEAAGPLPSRSRPSSTTAMSSWTRRT